MTYHHGHAKAGAKIAAVDLIAPERPLCRTRSASQGRNTFSASFLTVVDAEFEDLGPTGDAVSPSTCVPGDDAADNGIRALRPRSGFVTAGAAPDPGRSQRSFPALAGFLCLLSFWACGGHALAERALSALAPASSPHEAGAASTEITVSDVSQAVTTGPMTASIPMVISGGRIVTAGSSHTEIIGVADH